VAGVSRNARYLLVVAYTLTGTPWWQAALALVVATAVAGLVVAAMAWADRGQSTADLDTWAARHWRLWRLLHPWRTWGPRCAAEPPWRLADAGPCIVYRGHDHTEDDGQVWHADGTGYIWSATRWAWRGPLVDLSDDLLVHPARDDSQDWLFTEGGPT
jgi:hypothetical protein